jgi:hypothetical protein
MDKKMSRQILFKPGQTVSKVLNERANSVTRIDTTANPKEKEAPTVRVELSVAEKSKRLYKWISTHPLINLNGLCKNTGADRANFMKMAVAEKELKSEVLNKFITELIPYGYTE